MSELSQHAQAQPDKPACVMGGSGERLTYRQLEERSTQVAHLIRSYGVEAGGVVAVLMPNDLRFCEILWGSRKAGVYLTPLSVQLRREEVTYMLRDSRACVTFVSDTLLDRIDPALLAAGLVVVPVSSSGDGGYDAAVERFSPLAPLVQVPSGRELCYSSGTTGHPKAIKHSLTPDPAIVSKLRSWVAPLGYHPDMVYLSPGPIYHAAALRFIMRTHTLGGTVIVMRKFDARAALGLIEEYRVTHSQWVPTMFYRMLQIPIEERAAFDLSSQETAIHAAAPCPPDIKRRMIDWWGPIVWEYYSGTEQNGITLISTREWLEHPGSVGRAVVGEIHILGDDGRELPTGEVGDVYFDGVPFEYLNDPAKTAASRNAAGWSTLGDMGYVDDDGYLYLTDRRSHTIISGGVNIYPAEIEAILLEHPLVRDAGVVGLPNEEFGQEVAAAVEVAPTTLSDAEIEAALIAYTRTRLAGLKCPRRVFVSQALPRLDSGKLQKARLKEMFAGAAA